MQALSPLPTGTALFSSIFNYRHDARRISVGPEVELLPGVRLLRGEERTNYPLGVSIDDHASGFNITAQVVNAIGAARICEFMHAARPR